jgi:hypothetical protein
MPGHKSAAASSGKTAFFALETWTSPLSAHGPCTTKFSIVLPPFVTNSLPARRRWYAVPKRRMHP